LQSLPLHILQVPLPQKEKLFSHLSKSLANEPTVRVPGGPLWREMTVSRDFSAFEMLKKFVSGGRTVLLRTGLRGECE
jgi:hypothetical protein